MVKIATAAELRALAKRIIDTVKKSSADELYFLETHTALSSWKPVKVM